MVLENNFNLEKFNPEVLREYDIRGIVDKDLSVNTAYTIGRTFGHIVCSKFSKKKIAVGSVVGAVVLLLIVGPNKATPSPIPEVEEPEVAVVVEPVIEDTILEMTIVSEKVMFCILEIST